ncbi:hypothetical protein [Streptomyces sp. NPDC058579]|uniref:hypothetical protein n=1 Tax=Streptomyces sp. NPDC058579 TaxID=3346548 RepID=UPI0036478602
MKDGKPWVGDQVRDEATNRKAIVTDVRAGSFYVLRPIAGGGAFWEVEDPKRLTVIEPAGGGGP